MGQSRTVMLPLIGTRYILCAALLAAVLVTVGTAWTVHFWRNTDQQWSEVDSFFRFLTYLDLGHEDNVGAWLSSMLLLSIAAVAMLCFLADRNPSRRWLRGGWLVSAFIFTGLSFTELGSVHERLPNHLFETYQMTNHVRWVIWLGPVILAIPLFMSAFAWLRLRRIPGALGPMIGGILFLSSIPLQELLEQNMIAAAGDEIFVRRIPFLILEEGSELVGMLCFLAAFLVAADHLASTLSSGARVIPVRVSGQPWLFLVKMSVAALVLFLGAAALQDLLPPDSRSGTPANWPPSAFAFLAGMVALSFGSGKRSLTDKVALVALGLAGLTLSMLSAVTRLDLLEQARHLTILLMLTGAFFASLAARREVLALALLVGAALAVHLAPPWYAQNNLLVAAVLLAAAVILREYATEQGRLSDIVHQQGSSAGRMIGQTPSLQPLDTPAHRHPTTTG